MPVEYTIKAAYLALRSLILNPASYTQVAKMDNAIRYIDFVEDALTRPYNRVCHLAAFVRDMDGLLSAKMSPFCFLSDEVKAVINSRYLDVERIVADVQKEEPTADFDTEPHLS